MTEDEVSANCGVQFGLRHSVAPVEVFISYAHEDNASSNPPEKRWLDRLRQFLKPLTRQRRLSFWSDLDIKAGGKWRLNIESQLEKAKVAILLVSPAFLDSDFITNSELPVLLKNAAEKGVRILSLLIKPSLFEYSTFKYPDPTMGPEDLSLVEFQAVNPPSKTLLEMDEASQYRCFEKLAKDLMAYLQTSTPQPGTPPKVDLSALPASVGRFFGRKHDLELLNHAWKETQTSIFMLSAWGGAGKTSLVNHWLSELKHTNYDGAAGVYGWSFYSQGTADGRQASSDEFLLHALDWLGDPAPERGDPIDKATRLAGRIQQERYLLILDGVEPLQHPPGPSYGYLRDQGLAALLKHLAAGQSGLCVVTTRVPVEDLMRQATGVRHLPLENLAPEEGVELLNCLGVKQEFQDELRKAVVDFQGHALALTLLGRLLAVHFDGDIRKRDLIPALNDEKEHGGHARRVMKWYETFLNSKPDLQILFLLGLFDRPVEAEAIKVLRDQPIIEGLTAQIDLTHGEGWKQAVERLQGLRLIDKEDTRLDCHPLVREHFGQALSARNPAAWKIAHGRLFGYFKGLPEKQHGKFLPDTLTEMESLFRAVAHGCRGGHFKEAFNCLYKQRILREQMGGQNIDYAEVTLGAFGACHAALRELEHSANEPQSGSRETDLAFIHLQIGYCLRAFARMRESSEHFEKAMRIYKQSANWAEAAKAAGRRSILHLFMGEIEKAEAYACESVRLGDKDGCPFERAYYRTTLALVICYAGRVKEASELFQEAQDLLTKAHGKHDPGRTAAMVFRWCECLEIQGRNEDVVREAQNALLAAEKNKAGLLFCGLLHTALGRALMRQGGMEGLSDARSVEVEEHLKKAIRNYSEGGTWYELPRGFLAQAEFCRLGGRFDEAWEALEQVREVADRRGVGLHLPDYHLEAVRLSLALAASMRGRPTENHNHAREHLKSADLLLERMGYGRRRPEYELTAARLALQERDLDLVRTHVMNASRWVVSLENGGMGFARYQSELDALNEELVRIP